jgi:hypothetical protein
LRMQWQACDPNKSEQEYFYFRMHGLIFPKLRNACACLAIILIQFVLRCLGQWEVCQQEPIFGKAGVFLGDFG